MVILLILFFFVKEKYYFRCWFCFHVRDSGVEYISCCVGIFDVASEKQTQDIDTHNIRVCRDSGYDAIHHKVCFPYCFVVIQLSPSNNNHTFKSVLWNKESKALLISRYYIWNVIVGSIWCSSYQSVLPSWSSYLLSKLNLSTSLVPRVL